MSETFLIKKTAFNDVSDVNTRTLTSFVIGPGELNGPAGASRDSDMRLFGFGSLKWGEGVDQNVFRLLENLACPRKILNDYNPNHTPTTDVDDDKDKLWFDYNPTVHPILPKDERDFGVGNGITIPVVGQSWYDTTTKTLFSYNGTYWVTTSIEPGTIRIDAKTTMSVNDLECNGQVVSRSRYAALFAEIGTTFGAGIDSNTFNVPKITAPAPVSGTVIYIIRT